MKHSGHVNLMSGARRREMVKMYAARARTVLCAERFSLRIITAVSDETFKIRRNQFREIFTCFAKVSAVEMANSIDQTFGEKPLPKTFSIAFALILHRLVVCAGERGFTLTENDAEIVIDARTDEMEITGFESSFVLPPLGRIDVWASQ